MRSCLSRMYPRVALHALVGRASETDFDFECAGYRFPLALSTSCVASDCTSAPSHARQSKFSSRSSDFDFEIAGSRFPLALYTSFVASDLSQGFIASERFPFIFSQFAALFCHHVAREGRPLDAIRPGCQPGSSLLSQAMSLLRCI